MGGNSYEESFVRSEMCEKTPNLKDRNIRVIFIVTDTVKYKIIFYFY